MKTPGIFALNSSQNIRRKRFELIKYKHMINKGLYFYRKKNYKIALKKFIQARNFRPDLAEAFYNIACMSSLLGKHDDAIKNLKETFIRNINWQKKAKNDSDFYSIRKRPKFLKLVNKRKFKKSIVNVMAIFYKINEINIIRHSNYPIFSITLDKNFTVTRGGAASGIFHTDYGKWYITGNCIHIVFTLRVIHSQSNSLDGSHVPERRWKINIHYNTVVIRNKSGILELRIY